MSGISEFKADWRPGTFGDACLLRHPVYGMYLHMVVHNCEGQPLYDLPVHMGPGGAVILPIDQNGRIGLIHQFRSCVFQEGLLNPFPHLPNSSDFGRWSWECCRGFTDPGEIDKAKTGQRELLEEMKLTPLRLGGDLHLPLVRIGELITDTANISTPIDLFVAHIEASQELELDPMTENEPIQAIRYFSLSEIQKMTKEGKIFCAFTKSALWQAWSRGLL